MKILLTGATGFLGSSILKALLSKNLEVIVIKRSFSDTGRIKKELLKTKNYDIDKKSPKDIFKENKDISAVIHTATCYGRKNETPEQIREANFLFPSEILRNAAENGTEKFINTSSFFQRITDKDHPMYLYIETKREFSELGMSFTSDKPMRFTDIEMHHLYGPSDDRTKFIPRIIKNCLENASVLNLTAGEQRRDFIFIDDAVEGYLQAIEHKSPYNERFSFGTGKSLSVRETVETIASLVRSSTKLNFGAEKYLKGELMDIKADIGINTSLRWKAKTGFEEGIAKTIDWVRQEDDAKT